MQIENGALDILDERNYQYSILMGSTDNLPESILLDTGYVQNQATDGYKMGCVYYSSGEATNYLNGNLNRLKGSELCNTSKTRDSEKGDYIINGPKLLKKLGNIQGYAQVNSLYEIKHSIANKRPVAVGSNTIDWNTIRNSPYKAKGDSGAGHAFHIIGYNDKKEILIFKNSYGKLKFDKGLFYIDYKDFDKLLYLTRLSLVESKESILAYKKQIMENINIGSAKKAFEDGIWNGRNPKDTASREEVAAMIYRALEKLKS